MTDFFIGVDGGGTKCKIRVANEQGVTISQSLSGPANIAASVDQAWLSINTGLEAAFEPLNISLKDPAHRFHACFGLAGCELKEAYADFLTRSHYFKNLHVTTDAHIACVGAHEGQDGAIIIIGTGIVGYQTYCNKTFKVSGWGFPYDDEGSGAWLGMEAIKLTLQWIDGRIEKTPFLIDIFDFFNQDLNAMIAWSKKSNATQYAMLVPFIIKHAQQEDLNALSLLKKAANAVNQIGQALQKQHSFSLKCSLIGGVAPYIEPFLSEDLKSTLIPSKQEPCIGAILLLRQLLQDSV